VEPPEESISAPWEFLLMEGAQFRDETMHLGEGDTLLVKHTARWREWRRRPFLR
jgi:hypothetical protein